MSGIAATMDGPIRAKTDAARPGLGRLAGVELRKMVDTRAGFWLLAVTTLLTLAIAVVLPIAGDDSDRTLTAILSTVIQPAGVLLPIVGILLVASEWSQRTTLTTFSLIPDRSRIVIAKVLAGLAISLIATGLCLICSIAATAFGSGIEDQWKLGVDVLAQVFLYLALSISIGIAFGAAWLIPAPAIVVIFALPVAISLLSGLSMFEGLGGWIDQSQTLAPLVEDSLDGKQWAQVATTLGVWFVTPMLIGTWRIRRDEIS